MYIKLSFMTKMWYNVMYSMETNAQFAIILLGRHKSGLTRKFNAINNIKFLAYLNLDPHIRKRNQRYLSSSII